MSLCMYTYTTTLYTPRDIVYVHICHESYTQSLCVYTYTTTLCMYTYITTLCVYSICEYGHGVLSDTDSLNTP